jgi:3-hydroxybutyrate dehydrogenase
LLDRGVNVLIADLGLRPEAEELVRKYSDGSPRAIFLRTDVTRWAELSRMFEVAQEHFGSIDIVCPGAGVFEPNFSNFWHPPGKPPSQDDSNGDRYALLDINITHPIRVTQLAISYFLSAKPKVSTSNPKSIIHIASTAGQASSLPVPMYHASKHAIIAFVRSLAKLESTLGIRVAAVAPGIIKTPLWTSEKRTLLKADDQWVMPEEVADAMVALVERAEVSSRFGDNAEQGEMITLGGGSIIEVTKGRLRDVPQFNNPGPSGVPGATASGIGNMVEEVHNLLSVDGWGKPT